MQRYDETVAILQVPMKKLRDLSIQIPKQTSKFVLTWV